AASASAWPRLGSESAGWDLTSSKLVPPAAASAANGSRTATASASAIPGRRTTRAARLRHWRSDRDRPAAARRAGPAPTRTSTLASARPERPNTVSRGPRASTDTVSRTLELGTEILRHGMTRSAPDGVPGPDAHHPEGDGTN